MLSCRITQLRRRAGINQLQLAEVLHLSPSTIGMYEQGRREPSMRTLVSIARELNVSTDYLLNTEGESTITQQVGAYLPVSANGIPTELLQETRNLLTQQEFAVLCMASLL